MTPSDTAHPEGERELLPCPFHGCGAQLIRDGGLSWIECEDFDCGGPAHETDAAAITAWNTRPVVRPQGEEGLREVASAAWKAWSDIPYVDGELESEEVTALWDAMDALKAALSNQGKPSS